MFDFKNQDVTADYYMFRNSNAKKVGTIAKNTTTPKVEAQQNVPIIGEPNDQTSAKPATTVKKTAAAAPKATTHKVQKGETLFSIAKSHGLTVDQLRKINRLGKSTNIKVGQVLKFS